MFSPAYPASAQPLMPEEVKVAELTVAGDRVTYVREAEGEDCMPCLAPFWPGNSTGHSGQIFPP